MATKLYVGGLPYATTDDELRSAFSAAGTVTSVAIIMDKMTGRSKGFGFVEMSSDAEAQTAIDTLCRGYLCSEIHNCIYYYSPPK